MKENNKPLISVILAVRNEAVNISRSIKSLRNQSYSNIEIIVVDNSSDEGKTVSIAKKLGVTVFQLPKKNGILNYRGAQVNLGVENSHGNIIFFPDADMTFDKDLLKEIAEKMEVYDALYIPETIVGRGFFGEVRNYERSFYNQTPIDALRVIKKALFKKIGGFDDKLIRFGADDWDLTKTVKLHTQKISITTNRLYHHEHILSLFQFLKKKHNYAGIFNEYIQKWGNDDEDIKKQLGLKYRAWDVFVENGKWKQVLAKPQLFLALGVIRLLTWISYLYKSHNLG